MATLVGKIIHNRYHVQEFLGRGGMAEVYKVWDSQRMTYLAMKVLLEDLALDRVFVRRFKREANTLERLQHPNIVRFFGFEKSGRSAFILMDYIEGETLKHFIHDAGGKSMPYGQIRVLTRSVCKSLHYAHSQHLVHCDIKPANIMVKESGVVQLADFGISRMSDAATATMVGAGTPAYMAPEQIQGQDPVPQTDIYALGVVLYEMFTGGERPFTGEQAEVTGGIGERVRWEHSHLQPPSPKKWNPSLSDNVEEVIMKCLEKDSDARYKTAIELYNALELALGNVQDETPKVRRKKSKGKTTIMGLPPSIKKQLRWVMPVLAVLAISIFFLAWNVNSSTSAPVSIPSLESNISVSAPIELEVPTTRANPTAKTNYTSTPIPTKTNTPMNAAYLGSIYTATVEPRKHSVPAGYECADKDKLYLSVGQWARTDHAGMGIYEEYLNYWDTSAQSIRSLPAKERILVFDGPVCSSDGHTWWFVKTESSQFGWVIEYLPGGYGHFFNPFTPK